MKMSYLKAFSTLIELLVTFFPLCFFFLSVCPHVQQLSSGGQRWGAAVQGEEEQERPEQWQRQEGRGQEIPEPGGGAAGDPAAAAAQEPHQVRSRQERSGGGGAAFIVLFCLS